MRIGQWRPGLADDRELWERIRRGDAEAFGSFYRTYAARLEAFLKHVLQDHQAAEDVTQETFARMWERPNGFDPQRGTLRAYLFGAGRKRASEWWRKRGTQVDQLKNDSGVRSAETAALVSDALSRMPEEQRSLLWLRETEGHSYEELAAILDVPVGTVRSRLFTAREGLRKIWRAEPKREQKL